MDLDFFSYVLKRLSVVALFIIGFCLLPGPRSLLAEFYGYLSAPESVEALKLGTQMSLVHFCWLFGFELPVFEFPENGENVLTALAIVVSIILQLVALRLGLFLWRFGWQRYYHRVAMRDELAEFGGFEDESELPIGNFDSDSTVIDSLEGQETLRDLEKRPLPIAPR
ncbi:MAG: hypothetical protein AB8B50_13445 [Pirellulaceae bacterium]